MPEPYLNYPVWPSEADEEQEAAQQAAAIEAQRAYNLADEIALLLDKHASYWTPEHLPQLEAVTARLHNIRADIIIHFNLRWQRKVV
jgi:hypothetical protein